MTKDKLFPELTGAALIDALDVHSVGQTTEEVEYTLTEEERARIAHRQSELSERETEIEDHLAEYTKPLKEEIKSIKAERKVHSRITKKGYQTSEQRIFWVQDFDNKKMLGYDSNGELVKTRAMRKQDAQMGIFNQQNINKAI